MTSLAERLSGIERSAIPVWVLGTEPMRFCWVNDLAVELWHAKDRADLLSRDLEGAPSSVVARTQAMMARIRQGHVLLEDWTLYPRGVPTPVRLHLSPIALDDGGIGILNQVLPTDSAPHPAVLRGIEALRHTPVMVALIGVSGDILMQNPAALRAFGDGSSWTTWFPRPDAARAVLEAALAGDVVQRELVVRTAQGERCHVVGAHAARDPVTGAMAVLVHHTDETERASAIRTAEAQSFLIEELNATLALVKKQRGEILTLSAPILEVGRRTIAVPITGGLDPERSDEIAARLLSFIAERGITNVIIDLTGAAALDTEGVGRLLQTLRAVRLLGARTMLTGIQPALARHLIAAGFEAADVSTARSVADGLSAAGVTNPEHRPLARVGSTPR